MINNHNTLTDNNLIDNHNTLTDNNLINNHMLADMKFSALKEFLLPI
jgi:hypothetical protein